MTEYDETTGLPTETHQAPDDVPKANPEIPLGTGIEINGEVITEAKIKFVGGMSPAALKNPPTRRGQTRAYIVLATCEKHHVKEINDETVVEIDMKPYVIYDRDLGPFGDQIERGPEEKVATDPDDDVKDGDDHGPGLFDAAGNVAGDLDGDVDDEVDCEIVDEDEGGDTEGSDVVHWSDAPDGGQQ
ncbi:hypothetical protein [Gordonia terrae]|uniref:hypothetical protein n=1 Tax=Gordonia terrae TaxID=2055 RepID=UPI003F6A77FB